MRSNVRGFIRIGLFPFLVYALAAFLAGGVYLLWLEADRAEPPAGSICPPHLGSDHPAYTAGPSHSVFEDVSYDWNSLTGTTWEATGVGLSTKHSGGWVELSDHFSPDHRFVLHQRKEVISNGNVVRIERLSCPEGQGYSLECRLDGDTVRWSNKTFRLKISPRPPALNDYRTFARLRADGSVEENDVDNLHHGLPLHRCHP